jgi:hypothetical protein
MYSEKNIIDNSDSSDTKIQNPHSFQTYHKQAILLSEIINTGNVFQEVGEKNMNNCTMTTNPINIINCADCLDYRYTGDFGFYGMAAYTAEDASYASYHHYKNTDNYNYGYTSKNNPYKNNYRYLPKRIKFLHNRLKTVKTTYKIYKY